MKFEKLMKTKLNNKTLRLVILTKNVNIFVLTRQIPMHSISTTINCDLQRCYNEIKKGVCKRKSNFCCIVLARKIIILQ